MGSRWASLGPAPQYTRGIGEGGRATCLAFGWDISPPNSPPHTLEPTIYVGTNGGGIFRSEGLRFNDPGVLSWTPTSDRFPSIPAEHKINIGNVTALAVDDLDPTRIFASTDAGLITSSDWGQTWTLTAPTAATLVKLIVDPSDPLRNTLWAAAGNRGLWHSKNAGYDWSPTSGLPSSFVVYDVEFTIAASGGVRLFVAGLVGADPKTAEAAFLESNDGGATWTSMPVQANDIATGQSAPLSAFGRITLAADHSRLRRPHDDRASLIAVVESRTVEYLLTILVVDSTGTWKSPTNAGLPTSFYLQGDNHPVCSTTQALPGITMFVGSATNGVWISDDRGTSWHRIALDRGYNPHVDGWSLLWANGALYYGCDGGIFRWTPSSGVLGTGAWTSLNTNGYSAHLSNGCDFHPHEQLVMMESAQDNGTALLRNNRWTYADAGDANRCRFDPVSAQYMFQSNPPNQVAADNSIHWLSRSSDGVNFTSVGNVPIIEAVPSDPVWEIHRTQAGRLVLGFSRVYETINSGDAVVPISPVLVDTKTPASAIAYLDAASILVAYDGRLFLTRGDHPAPKLSSWSQIDGNNFLSVVDIQVLIDDPTRIYVVDQGKPVRVFRSNDVGITWTELTGNLPVVAGYTLAAQSRVADGVALFLGTDVGVYAAIDRDEATLWSRFGDDFPDVGVSELRISSSFNLLGAATQGRGVFYAGLETLDDPTVAIKAEVDDCGVGFVENTTAKLDAIVSGFIRSGAPTLAWTVTGASIVGPTNQSTVAVNVPPAGNPVTISLTASDTFGNSVTATTTMQPIPVVLAVVVEILCQCFGPHGNARPKNHRRLLIL